MAGKDHHPPPGSVLADFLRLKTQFSEEDAPFFAELLGLAFTPSGSDGHESATEPLGRDVPQALGDAPNGDETTSDQSYPHNIPQLGFVRHLGYKPKHRRKPLPGVRKKTPVEKPKETTGREEITPRLLQPWEALWPFLRRAFSEAGCSWKLDVDRLVRLIAANQPIKSLPWRTQDTWPQDIVVVADHSRHLAPVANDFLEIIKRLFAWFPDRITLLMVENAERSAFVRIQRGSRSA